MAPSDKEVRHLRLVSASDKVPSEMASEDALPHSGPMLVDASLLVAREREGPVSATKSLLWPVCITGVGLLLSGTLLLALFAQSEPRPLIHARHAQISAPEPTRPSLKLIGHDQGDGAIAYSLRVHNLPLVGDVAASELAVAVVGPDGEIAWLAPSHTPGGTPWPILRVATMDLPQGPLLSGAQRGTRIIAMFLRQGAARDDIVHWVREVACESRTSLPKSLLPHVVHIETFKL